MEHTRKEPLYEYPTKDHFVCFHCGVVVDQKHDHWHVCAICGERRKGFGNSCVSKCENGCGTSIIFDTAWSEFLEKGNKSTKVVENNEEYLKCFRNTVVRCNITLARFMQVMSAGLRREFDHYTDPRPASKWLDWVEDFRKEIREVLEARKRKEQETPRFTGRQIDPVKGIRSSAYQPDLRRKIGDRKAPREYTRGRDESPERKRSERSPTVERKDREERGPSSRGQSRHFSPSPRIGKRDRSGSIEEGQ